MYYDGLRIFLLPFFLDFINKNRNEYDLLLIENFGYISMGYFLVWEKFGDGRCWGIDEDVVELKIWGLKW